MDGWMLSHIAIEHLHFNKIDEENLSYQIFPNPASDFLFVENTEIIHLYSVVGQHYSVPVKNGRAEIQSLAPGVYFYQFLDSDNKVKRGRIIKE